jgi:uncharacterized protein (TIGR03086 family)
MPMTTHTDPGSEEADQDHRRLSQAIGYADVVLDAVSARLLTQLTPCRGWNLRTLLEHAADSLAVLHEGLTAGRVAPDPAPAAVGADGSAAALVRGFRQYAGALLDASARADGDTRVAVGEHPLPVDSLRSVGALEIAVHAWDISQACGRCLPIPDELATGLLVQASLLVPRLGREPLFAAPAPVSARAPASDRLTAYLGRPVRPPR